MKSIVLALVAALLFMFVYSNASAEIDRNRYEGTIIADGTECIDYITGEVFAVYDTGYYVEILPKPPTDQSPDELVNTYSSANGLACYVPSFAVEYLPDSRVYDDVDTNELPALAPAEEIGTNIVNDYADCRTAPSLDAEVVTVLEPGTTVIEFADGVIDDGWQWVGLEATDCHVSADLLGEKVVTDTEVVADEPIADSAPVAAETWVEPIATNEPVTEDVSVTEGPVQTASAPVVEKLPSTGSGTAKIVASNLVFWGIVPVGLFVAACIARYLQAKGEKTMPVVSRRR